MAELRFSRRAVASLQSTKAYLLPLSPRAAGAVLAEIDYLCHLIADLPEIGRIIPDTDLRYLVTRKYRYRVIYRIWRGTVEIRDVMHPSRR